MIFGIVGYVNSGKDTVGNMLIDQGWQRVSVGDMLRNILYILDPPIYHEGEMISLKFLADTFGWDHIKRSFPVVRELLQRMGDAVKQTISPHIFINKLLESIAQDRKVRNLIMTDVRDPAEVRMIELLNGKIIRIDRPGCVPPNDHYIDNLVVSTAKPDYILQNDSTLDDLRLQLEVILSELREKDLLLPPPAVIAEMISQEKANG